MPSNQEDFSYEEKKVEGSDIPSTAATKSEPMTFGMKLVGITFNPSGDAKVNKAKELCAELADLIYDESKTSETSELKNILLPATFSSILAAQMNVVKVLTLKY